MKPTTTTATKEKTKEQKEKIENNITTMNIPETGGQYEVVPHSSESNLRSGAPCTSKQ